MRQLRKIIVHCTDSPDSNDKVNAKTIDKWHKDRGWSGIGYHFVILRDGVVEMGRPVAAIGAHVKGQNKDSIGVVLVGSKKFTDHQYSSLQSLIVQLWKSYGRLDVYGHRDFTTSKTCPNFDVKAWLDTWAKQKQSQSSALNKVFTWIKSLFR